MTANWRVRNFFLFLQFCEVFLRILSNANITNFFKVDNGWHEGIVYDCLWTAIHIFYFMSHIFYAINNWRPQFEINDNFSTHLRKKRKKWKKNIRKTTKKMNNELMRKPPNNESSPKIKVFRWKNKMYQSRKDLRR